MTPAAVPSPYAVWAAVAERQRANIAEIETDHKRYLAALPPGSGRLVSIAWAARAKVLSEVQSEYFTALLNAVPIELMGRA
jgi:hypothetical protein